MPYPHIIIGYIVILKEYINCHVLSWRVICISFFHYYIQIVLLFLISQFMLWYLMCCFFTAHHLLNSNPYQIDKFEGILEILHQKTSITFRFWHITREWLIFQNKVYPQKLFKIKFRFEWYIIWPYMMKFDYWPYGTGGLNWGMAI